VRDFVPAIGAVSKDSLASVDSQGLRDATREARERVVERRPEADGLERCN